MTTVTLREALTAQSALRNAAGLAPEIFPNGSICRNDFRRNRNTQNARAD